MGLLSFFKAKFFAAKFFASDMFLLGGGDVVVDDDAIPPGGSSGRKRKKLKLKGTLSEKKVRELTERVHKRRRSIWERPQEVGPETTDDVAAQAIVTPEAFIDDVFRKEAELVDVDRAIVKARSQIVELREERKRAEQRGVQRAKRVTEILEERARVEAERVAHEAQLREDDEAVLAMLLAA